MPKCKNVDTGTYKGTEPSPKGLGYCARGEKVGKKKKVVMVICGKLKN